MTNAQIIVLAALLVTLAILLIGVVAMAKGGDFNKKYGNKLMRMRVISQFAALILMGLFAMISAAD